VAKPNPFAKKSGAKPFGGKETAKEEKAEGKKMPPWLNKKPGMKAGGMKKAC
jgi:hypothetical protein